MSKESDEKSEAFCAKDWSVVIQDDLAEIQLKYGREEAILYLLDIWSRLYTWKRSVEDLKPPSTRRKQQQQLETWQWTTEMQIDLEKKVNTKAQPWEVLISKLFMDLEPMKNPEKILRKHDRNKRDKDQESKKNKKKMNQN